MDGQVVPPEAALGRTSAEVVITRARPAVSIAARRDSRALHQATDARLVTLVRQGEVAAFESIYDRYRPRIAGFCRRLVGDADEAADVVQHTFVAAYSAIVASEKPILLRAWLYTIARNRCYSVLRARRNQRSADYAEPVSEALATQVLRREHLREVLTDVGRLPQDQRAALVMAGIGMVDHRQVAATLGIPHTKVKALVYQAREALMAAQKARETDCSEIREQLRTLHGGALRRGNLRRHLRDCQACQEFSTQLACWPKRPVLQVGPIDAVEPPARTLTPSA